MSTEYGIYRRSRFEWESWAGTEGWKGNTGAASALVKRAGKHLTFKRKKDAQAWVAANSKKEPFYVRKVSKPVK